MGSCKKEGTIYSITCLVCEAKGRRRIYWGETGRSTYEREREHWELWEKKSENSCLNKHDVLEHGGTLMKNQFRIKVEEKSRTVLARQVGEGVRIEEESPECILNSKSEFGHNRVPQIQIQVRNTILRELGAMDSGDRMEEIELVREGEEERLGDFEGAAQEY